MRSYVSLLLIAALLPGCADLLDSIKVEPSKPIRIGGVFDTSYSLSQVEAPALRGARLAVEQINSAGGLFGNPLEFVVRETRPTGKKIRASVGQLIHEERVDALVGLCDTNSVMFAEEIVKGSGVPFLSTGATSPRVVDSFGETSTLLLTAFGDNEQAALAAEYAMDTFGSKGLIIYENAKEHPILMSKYFKKRFEELGGQIAGSSYFVGNPPMLRPALRQLKNVHIKPDFIYLATMPRNAEYAVKQLRLAGYKAPIIGGDSFDIADIRTASASEIGQVYFTTHAYVAADSSSEKARAFYQAYRNRYGAEPENSFAALGYDSIQLMATAMKTSGSTDAGKIMEALQGMKDYEGVTGPIIYGENRRVPYKDVTILRVGANSPELIISKRPEKIPVP